MLPRKSHGAHLEQLLCSDSASGVLRGGQATVAKGIEEVSCGQGRFGWVFGQIDSGAERGTETRIAGET